MNEEAGKTISHLGTHQLSPRLAEPAVLLEPKEELASSHVVQDHVELVIGLKGVDEVDKEGVLNVLEDVTLGGGVEELVALDECGLAESLHGIERVVSTLFLHEHDLSERSLAEDLQELEVVDPQLLSARSSVFAVKLNVDVAVAKI